MLLKCLAHHGGPGNRFLSCESLVHSDWPYGNPVGDATQVPQSQKQRSQELTTVFQTNEFSQFHFR